ncbi:hypothetical protein J4734_11535 [Klebsiella pneumoniae]|uniref:Uncharacterized protein n=1 Tax=Klebsiella pneumoniae TaxID=573 RepID=A0A939SQ44_KLEPN|nr:hypothetical protein [Klebsiella pneumoniae]
MGGGPVLTRPSPQGEGKPCHRAKGIPYVSITFPEYSRNMRLIGIAIRAVVRTACS